MMSFEFPMYYILTSILSSSGNKHPLLVVRGGTAYWTAVSIGVECRLCMLTIKLVVLV